MKRLVLVFFLLFIVVQCSWARVSVIGNLTHEKSAQPGQSYDGIILLKNDGDTPSEAKIYQTDYTFSADGKNSYGDPGVMTRSNAKWISFTPPRVNVPPHETAEVNYTIRVPDSKELTGSYWSMIMVEPIAEESPEAGTPEKGKVKVGLATVVRYGIQIVTTVGDSGKKDIKFINKNLMARDGKIYFQLDIENTGERLVIPLVWIELYNKSGAYVGRFESGRLRIYPACSVRHEIDLTDVPKGEYKALVVADNGDDQVFGAEYTLSIK